MSDKPGCTTLDQLDGAAARRGRDRADLVGQLLRAVRGAGGHARGRAGAGGCRRPRRADAGPRPAPAQPPPSAGLVLRARRAMAASCATSPRTRSTSSCTSPARPTPRSSRAPSATSPTRTIPGCEDFGEVLLRSDRAHRLCPRRLVHARRPADLGRRAAHHPRHRGLPSSCRKYVDIAGRDGTDHLFLVDRTGTRHIDCRDAPLPYYAALVRDVAERSETAMPQAHCFKVMELALRAQARAARVGQSRMSRRPTGSRSSGPASARSTSTGYLRTARSCSSRP